MKKDLGDIFKSFTQGLERVTFWEVKSLVSKEKLDDLRQILSENQKELVYSRNALHQKVLAEEQKDRESQELKQGVR